jgi:hypothetical protein
VSRGQRGGSPTVVNLFSRPAVAPIEKCSLCPIILPMVLYVCETMSLILRDDHTDDEECRLLGCYAVWLL